MTEEKYVTTYVDSQWLKHDLCDMHDHEYQGKNVSKTTHYGTCEECQATAAAKRFAKAMLELALRTETNGSQDSDVRRIIGDARMRLQTSLSKNEREAIEYSTRKLKSHMQAWNVL